MTCFGMTTVLLNLHNAGLFKLDAPILAMGIFLGGSVQIIAGVLEFKKGNTFGMTAFCAYGAFWLTLCFILIGKPFLLKPLAMEASARGLAWYLLLWGIFTCFMFIGTFKVNKVLQLVFFTLIILFGLLVIHFVWFVSPGSTTAVLKLAGIVGIVCGGTAIYLAMAELINEMYGRVILPIGPVKA